MNEKFPIVPADLLEELEAPFPRRFSRTEHARPRGVGWCRKARGRPVLAAAIR